jgi:hypothetical protein
MQLDAGPKPIYGQICAIEGAIVEGLPKVSLPKAKGLVSCTAWCDYCPRAGKNTPILSIPK